MNLNKPLGCTSRCGLSAGPRARVKLGRMHQEGNQEGHGNVNLTWFPDFKRKSLKQICMISFAVSQTLKSNCRRFFLSHDPVYKHHFQ